MSTDGKRSPDTHESCWPGARSAGPRPGTSWRPVPGPAFLRMQYCAQSQSPYRGRGESTNAPGRTRARHTAPQRRRPSCGDGRADRAPASVPRAPSCAAPEAPAENRFRPEIPARLSAGGLFLIAGHACLTHWPMPSSSRSIALRTGLCGLQFMACNRRQM